MSQSFSVVLPAKDEDSSIGEVIRKVRNLYSEIEIVVVDDGSMDRTKEVAEAEGARVISHPYSQGNGAAIKTGARHAEGDVLVFMDADGQHKAEDIPRLLARLEEGYDMVVGARTEGSQASTLRSLGNRFYNSFASLIVGQQIEDLTSGFRVVKAVRFRQFLYLLPNKFSYPTTITMAFFRSGFPVAYEPIVANQRSGESHLNVWKDGLRFLLIIFKVGTLFSPLKIFFPFSVFQFLVGCGYYGYTFVTAGRFTNMSALLFTSAITVFLMGLVSEQITALMYRSEKEAEIPRESE